MRIIAILVLLAASASTGLAQTAPCLPPSTRGDTGGSSYVRAPQRGDGSRLVDITRCATAALAVCCLNPTTDRTPHHAAGTVWVVLSGDGGVSWSEQGDLP